MHPFLSFFLFKFVLFSCIKASPKHFVQGLMYTYSHGEADVQAKWETKFVK